jgi:bifunctional UDP-N-acetylglucosamine pyrophosphorylase / glucosamine-1-phosphate N-acetyltransferase
LTVVVLAAGLGTRMKSRKAKVLHRAGGRYLIEHVLRTALALAPPERIFVVVGHQSAEVRAAVQTSGVGFIEQTEQKGTGHALMVAADALSAPGNGRPARDSLRRLPAGASADARRPGRGAAILRAAGAILTAAMDDPTGYGRVLRDRDGHVTGVVEQRAGTPEQLAIREANMGLYCYRAAPFWRHIQELRPG